MFIRLQYLIFIIGLAVIGCDAPDTAETEPLQPAFVDDETATGFSSRPENPDCTADQLKFQKPAAIRLQRVFPQLSFNQGLLLLQDPASKRWLIVQRRGMISSFDQAGENPETVADLSTLVGSDSAEEGLLGLAFHPNYPDTAEIYASYTDKQGDSVISRFNINPTSGQIDLQSESILLTQSQPYPNHNGGHIAFGPDGFLYIALGDGGDAGDPQDHSQNTTNLLGAMLRIDVSEPQLKIPADNPFAANAACGENSNCPEIWAWGLRNPWRWSFDSASGKLWAGDVGQSQQEEINIIEQGKNYGWRCYEGSLPFNTDQCGVAEDYASPVAEYGRDLGISVTGGYVYRGTELPDLYGYYLFADFSSGTIWGLDSSDPSAGFSEFIQSGGLNISTFAQDLQGELYLLDYYGGGIYKIVADETAVENQTTLLSENRCMQTDNPQVPVPGAIPYSVNAELWSDNASKQRWFAIPDGSQITIDNQGNWEFPNGSVVIKHFSQGENLLETRFLVRADDGAWQGYSYAWDEQGQDAILLQNAETREIHGQTWEFPAGQCFQCHTQGAGITLGPENSQMNRQHLYPESGIEANQLQTLSHIGLLAAAHSQTIDTVPALSDWTDIAQPLQARARAFLHANCSNCHRPGGSGRGDLDLRFNTALEDMGACNQAAQFGTTETDTQLIISPGNAVNSVLFQRISTDEPTMRMPPLGITTRNTVAVSLMQNWINSLNQCEETDD